VALVAAGSTMCDVSFGADTANPLDVTAAAAGSSPTANSSPATPTVANELIFSTPPPPDAGFTTRIITQHDSDIAEDEIGTSVVTPTPLPPRFPQRVLAHTNGDLQTVANQSWGEWNREGTIPSSSLRALGGDSDVAVEIRVTARGTFLLPISAPGPRSWCRT